jgi:hypothetical protein
VIEDCVYDRSEVSHNVNLFVISKDAALDCMAQGRQRVAVGAR